MKTRISLIICVAIVATSSAFAATQDYSTNFDAAENPISESGIWSHAGLDWTVVATSNGFAHGTQSGTGGYDDSYAVLTGFSPNQSSSAVVHIISSIDPSCSHEVELLLRWSDAPHSAQGYELNVSFDGGYAQIVRWNGAIGDFTVLGGGSYPGGLKENDVVAASIAGNVISLSVNGTKLAEVTDSTYAAGNPGIGFFRRACGANTDLGFTSFSASGSDTTSPVVPRPPTNVTVH